MEVTSYLLCLSTIFLIYNYAFVECKGQEDAAYHLNLGNSFLSKGQFAEALHHYHSAVDLDPNNYQTLYRRATVLLATGKMKAALPDLDRVVELKPDFIAGRMQRGNILMKQGKLSEAAADFRYSFKHDGEHQAESREKIQLIDRLQEWIEQATDYLENDNYGSAETLLDHAIEHCQWDPDLHRKRSKCRLARNDVHNAIADIRALANLVPDSTDAFLEMSRMYYEIGDVENSLVQIRECLKLNPDHKECFPFYKKIKKLAKMRESLKQLAAQEKWMDCLDKAQQILKAERKIENIQLDVFRYSCKCNLKLDHIAEAIQECSEVLTHINENDLDALLNRGDAYLASEEYDKAIEDFQKAVNAHGDSRRAKEALERARKTQKMAQKKDYYKILGLRRNANKKDITRAYRKLAQQWHPDNFQDPAEKEKAQAKFIDIARAKEVLSDPEKRRIYDAGEDPLDPQGGHHGHGGQQWQQHWGDMPFGQGFPFGGGQQGGSGGYTFKFHFG